MRTDHDELRSTLLVGQHECCIFTGAENGKKVPHKSQGLSPLLPWCRAVGVCVNDQFRTTCQRFRRNTVHIADNQVRPKTDLKQRVRSPSTPMSTGRARFTKEGVPPSPACNGGRGQR